MARSIREMNERVRQEAAFVQEIIQETNRIIANTTLKLFPVKNLSIDYTVGVDNSTANGTTFIPPFAYNVNTVFFGGGANLDPTLNGYSSAASNTSFLINNEELTENAKAAAIEFLGEENVKDLDIWMAAEDFAFYSQEIPACFYRLGVRNESKGIISSVHTPTFNIDEKALETGMGLMAFIAISRLTGN